MSVTVTEHLRSMKNVSDYYWMPPSISAVEIRVTILLLWTKFDMHTEFSSCTRSAFSFCMTSNVVASISKHTACAIYHFIIWKIIQYSKNLHIFLNSFSYLYNGLSYINFLYIWLQMRVYIHIPLLFIPVACYLN